MAATRDDLEHAIMAFGGGEGVGQAVADLAEAGAAVAAEEAAAVFGVSEVHVAGPEAGDVAGHGEAKLVAVEEVAVGGVVGRAEVSADACQAGRGVVR